MASLFGPPCVILLLPNFQVSTYRVLKWYLSLPSHEVCLYESSQPSEQCRYTKRPTTLLQQLFGVPMVPAPDVNRLRQFCIADCIWMPLCRARLLGRPPNRYWMDSNIDQLISDVKSSYWSPTNFALIPKVRSVTSTTDYRNRSIICERNLVSIQCWIITAQLASVRMSYYFEMSCWHWSAKSLLPILILLLAITT